MVGVARMNFAVMVFPSVLVHFRSSQSARTSGADKQDEKPTTSVSQSTRCMAQAPQPGTDEQKRESGRGSPPTNAFPSITRLVASANRFFGKQVGAFGSP